MYGIIKCKRGPSIAKGPHSRQAPSSGCTAGSLSSWEDGGESRERLSVCSCVWTSRRRERLGGAGAMGTEHVPGAGSAPGRLLGCSKRMTSVRPCIWQSPCEAANVSVLDCARGSHASVWLKTALDRPRPPLCPSTPLLCPAVRPRHSQPCILNVPHWLSFS